MKKIFPWTTIEVKDPSQSCEIFSTMMENDFSMTFIFPHENAEAEITDYAVEGVDYKLTVKFQGLVMGVFIPCSDGMVIEVNGKNASIWWQNGTVEVIS